MPFFHEGKEGGRAGRQGRVSASSGNSIHVLTIGTEGGAVTRLGNGMYKYVDCGEILGNKFWVAGGVVGERMGSPGDGH